MRDGHPRRRFSSGLSAARAAVLRGPTQMGDAVLWTFRLVEHPAVGCRQWDIAILRYRSPSRRSRAAGLRAARPPPSRCAGKILISMRPPDAYLIASAHGSMPTTCSGCVLGTQWQSVPSTSAARAAWQTLRIKSRDASAREDIHFVPAPAPVRIAGCQAGFARPCTNLDTARQAHKRSRSRRRAASRRESGFDRGGCCAAQGRANRA